MTQHLGARLTYQDAAFLYFERRNAPLHIGSLGIYRGRIPFEQFVAHIDSRLPLIPRYRQRLIVPPFSLAHPSWQDDPDFDIRNHIFHVALPTPGDDRQLAELTARLFSPILDRGKPLWEMYVIEGLEGDRTAILSKVHHCLVDGVSGIELLLAVVDITPEPAPPPDAPPWEPPPLPDAWSRLVDAWRCQVNEGIDLLQRLREGLAQPTRSFEETQTALRALRQAAPWLLRPAPATPFSVHLGPERRTAFAEVSFVEIREIRTSLGGTVNDVVLAVLAGALRRYLIRHGHRIGVPRLRVGVPVNIRTEAERGALGNRISFLLTELPVDEADPAVRLTTIAERVTGLKAANQAQGFELVARLLGYAPAPFQQFLGATAVASPLINLICTNVPGPMIPLYSIGHLMLAHYPLVPLSFDMGLGVGVTSYHQRLYFGLMADPRAVPDLEFLAQCVDESFRELRAAAGVDIADLPAVGSRDGGAVPAAPEAVGEGG